MQRTTLISSLFALFANLAMAQTHCDQLQARIDSLANLDQVVQYLKLEVDKQQDLRDLFVCDADAQRLPTDLLAGDRDFIYGDGWGSVYANANVPLWNQFQSQLGRSVWGGKILRKTADGVDLLNVMLDRRTMSYAAQVYNAPSVVDGADSIVLDYRKDTTVAVVSQLVIQRVRDELREISYRGEKTGIYLGRAYLFTGNSQEKFSSAWQDTQKFVFAANFMLDFRAQNQDSIPAWALKFFE